MEKITFKRAFYIKLGRQGVWESDLLFGKKARIGYSNIDLSDILQGKWEIIKKDIKKDYSDRGKKTGVTQDFNVLKTFCESTEDVVFITFHDSKLYWCTLDEQPLQEDDVSKFRTTKTKWNFNDIKGKPLYINQISGRISKIQGFRGTICQVNEVDVLKRIINAEKNETHLRIEAKKQEMAQLIYDSFTDLHWSDMEVLADLIFRESGWQRVSMVGGKMKDIDLELVDPITKDFYQVQVKAEAALGDFINYSESYSGLKYKKLFFVVFQPQSSLVEYKCNSDNIQLIKGVELAELIIDLGLTNWLLKKIL